MGLSAELGIRRHGRGPWGSFLRWLAGTRPGAFVFGRTLRYLDRSVLLLSGGRFSIADHVAGVPTLLLTTTGARSGQRRTSQLIAVPFGDDFAVIGSNFGRTHHPGWVHNLTADPKAVAAHRGTEVPVVARELTGTEAEQVWALGRELYDGFRTYPGMVRRTIRVFALTPA